MKFKKTVGALSALAITVSAFAGMAVTANAAGENYDTLNGWSVTNPANRVVGNVTQGIDGDMNYTTVQITGSALYNGSYHGCVHIDNGSGKNADTRTQGTRVATQKIRFSEGSGSNFIEYIGDAYRDGGGDFRGIYGLAQFSYNDAENKLTIKAGDGEAKQVEIIDNTWYDLKVTAVYSETGAVVTMTVGDVTVTGNAANRDIDAITVTTINRDTSVNKFDSAEEKIATISPAVTEFTLNYVNEENTIIKANTIELVDKYIGDNYTYYYPAYIQSDSGEWYKSVSTTYSNSLVLNTESVTANVTYTPVNNTIYFAENEDLENNGDIKESSALSSGKGARVLNTGAEAFTVEESGIYRITIPAYCRNTRNESVYAVYKNSVAEENKIASGDAKGYSQNGPYIGVEENVELNAGDKIIIAGDEGNTAVDYVLAEKTGELEIPQPVAPGAVAATHSQDFTTNGDCASLWTATLTGVEGLSFDGIKVTAENSNGNKAENTASTTTITGESSIAVYIAVNLAMNTPNSDGVKVTGVDAQLVEIR